MISECLEDLHEPTDLHLQYELPAKHNQPALMICNDKRTKQNKDTLFHYTDNRPVRIGNTERYEIFNVRNLTNSAGALQKGYSRNIDIDSELKRINHYDDKCFQDNYKIHPMEVTPEESPLAIHRNTLVHDYQIKRFTTPNKCIDKDSVQNSEFEKCSYLPNLSSVSTNNNEPVYYEFNNEGYVCNYPCQRLFHNQTKRTTIPNNRNNQFQLVNRK